MKIVTSGAPYMDIDAYAGCVAYAELLQAQGFEARAVSTAPLNESISETVRSWRAPLYTSHESSQADTYALIDISDPEYFDTMVVLDRVDTIIDHHTGFEEYWRERIGDKAYIEFIGAACTLVYEHWKQAGLLNKMSVTSARLLVYGILDNTLNFGAKVTTPRDSEAYDDLLTRADLPADWTAQYFRECQRTILSDITRAIRNDTKTLSFKSFEQPVAVGQLTAWDSTEVLSKHQATMQKTLASVRPDWFMNLISVSERKSYFVTDNIEVQKWLTGLLGVQFDGTIAIADRLWLRKEILKQDSRRVVI